MDAVLVAVVLVLILAGIWDLFMTVLYYDAHYDAAGPLSLRLFKLVWSVLRRVANRVRILWRRSRCPSACRSWFWRALRCDSRSRSFGFAFIYS